MEHNLSCLNKLNSPNALIETKHTGNGKSMSADVFMGLQVSLHLAVGARVLLTWNLSQGAGLVNGSVGTVMDIVHDEEEDNETSPTCVPEHVWVDFGVTYTGPSFFPDNPDCHGWFPVEPLRATETSGANQKESSRTMIPL